MTRITLNPKRVLARCSTEGNAQRRDEELLTHAMCLTISADSLFGANVILHTRRQGIARTVSEPVGAVNDELGLLARVSKGDKDVFATLYDRHSPLVYGIAKRILGDATQAEDVTQSVFTMLWARPQAFGGGNFGAWIARVARNAALDVVRSAAVRTREPEMPEDLASDNDLEDEVFSRLRSSAVNQALKALPEDQREAIEQAYFQGLSYSQVATRIGAPLGTVKSRIRTGLRRLWETLQRQAMA